MPQNIIVNAFAEWAAFSSTRSGAPIKSREAVYPLIRKPSYNLLFNGPAISEKEFLEWHKNSTEQIVNCSVFPVGWAVKLINIYLKTRVYIAREGRENLYSLIHPPIDNGLWDGIGRYCRSNSLLEIKRKVFIVNCIKNITTYATYLKIIEGCQELAEHMHCELLEVEQLWEGTNF